MPPIALWARVSRSGAALALACAKSPSPLLGATPDALPPPVSQPVLAVADPAAIGLVAANLEALLIRATKTHSDALIVWKDGQIVVRWPADPEPIETMSMTKSFVSLGIGRLVDEGHIDDLDAPVSTWLAGFDDESHARITLRHVLSHHSGLATVVSREIYAAPDIVALARALPVVAEPGERFEYHNAVSNLLPAIGAAAGGVPFDTLVADNILAPVGIGPRAWQHDPAGNVHGGAGLALSADDLLKIGQMLLDGGMFDGKRVLSSEWIAQSTTPPLTDADFSHQWWRTWHTRACTLDDAVFEAWQAAGVDEGFRAALETLRGKPLDKEEVEAHLGGPGTIQRFYDNTWRRGLPDCTPDRVLMGFRADGWLGQHLVVLPEARLIAVRQMRSTEAHQTQGVAPDEDVFGDFPRAVVGLLASP